MGTPLTTIDPDKLKQLMANYTGNLPQISPPSGGAPATPQVPGLNFQQRQAAPNTAPIGSSAYYQNKLSKLEDQQANPLGSAENHPGVLGKIGHVLGTIGNKALDVTGINTIPGTEANRLARISYDQAAIPKAQEVELGQKREAANETYQQGELADRAKGRELEGRKQDFEEAKPLAPETESIQDLMGQDNPDTHKPYTAEEAEVKRAKDLAAAKPEKPDSASQEDQRYENIVSNEKQNKPVSPEDKAWSQAYEKRKTLAPYASVAAASQGTPTKVDDPLVQAVANGSMKIGDVLTARVPIGARKQFLASVMQANPQFNSADYDIEKGVQRDFTSGKSAQNLTAFNTAIDHAKIADTAVDALRNGDIHSLNRLGNALGVELGQDPVTNFNVVKNALAGEISKVFKGGQATDAEITHVMGPFDTANSPEQLKGAIHIDRKSVV